MRDPAGYLLFEDGSVFRGEQFHGADPACGEAVFNTAHSGYQEILTDPSYRRQILVFTAVHFGNVGVNRQDYESSRVQVSGVVVRNLTPRPSNWRSREDILTFLRRDGIPLLCGVDTRAVTLHIRSRGAMRAGIFPDSIPSDKAREAVLNTPSMIGADLTAEVTCAQPYRYTLDPEDSPWFPPQKKMNPTTADGTGLHVAVLDFGVKKNILRQLAVRGCAVTVFPAYTSADKLLTGDFHGALISNGPGDPAAVRNGIRIVRELIGRLPLFGICLGHQLLALAAGMETFKLPFGHRGANHPVRRQDDRVVEITSQNHGFAVRSEKMPSDWRVSLINLNDGTVEGLVHQELPVFSVQYHPEAGPGPHDGNSYFDRFIQEMRRARTH
jgi:carbamoyl-phosphate synthase small subunit